MEYKTLAKRLFSDTNKKYLQMMNIDVHTLHKKLRIFNILNFFV